MISIVDHKQRKNALHIDRIAKVFTGLITLYFSPENGCQICLEDSVLIEPMKKAVVLTCGHPIDEIAWKQIGNNKCPSCRTVNVGVPLPITPRILKVSRTDFK